MRRRVEQNERSAEGWAQVKRLKEAQSNKFRHSLGEYETCEGFFHQYWVIGFFSQTSTHSHSLLCNSNGTLFHMKGAYGFVKSNDLHKEQGVIQNTCSVSICLAVPECFGLLLQWPEGGLQLTDQHSSTVCVCARVCVHVCVCACECVYVCACLPHRFR